MYTSEGLKLRSLESQLAEQQKLTWGLLVLGIAIGFVGMHFIIARPLTRELERVKRDLVSVESRMQELAGTTEQVWETNSLLSSLKAQRAQFEDARDALQTVRQLRTEVLEETTQAAVAVAALDKVSALQQDLIGQQPSTEAATKAFEAMASLESRVIDQNATNDVATQSLSALIAIKDGVKAQASELPAVRSTLDQMGGITTSLKAEGDSISKANAGLTGLVTLKQAVLDGAASLEIAQSVGNQLLELQSRLAGQTSTVEAAQGNAAKLMTLGEKLHNDVVDAELAQRNLDAMLKMEATLTAQTGAVADAIQALEVLTAFQDEFATQIQILGEMRRSLVEIGMMETSVAKAVRMMQPLLELGNVRRMSDEELRNAAKVILERRGTRVSNNVDTTESLPGESGNLVPQPME